MLDTITNNWNPILQKIMLDYPDLETKLKEDKEKYSYDIFPPQHLIFQAFNLCPIDNLKIVIIGQDPYHQPNQANGLAFSVNQNNKLPPSLRNIFQEIKNDLGETNYQVKSGDLTYLANQGILLLNTTLTVRHSKPNSHLKLWKGFTQKVINYLLEEKEDIIFMLWGNNAKTLLSKKSEEVLKKHHIYKSTHPSPLSANRGGWFGQKMFSRVNEKLRELEKEEIKWLE